MLRKRATHAVPRPGVRFYIISLSSTTIVYKGQLTSEQVWTYFLDLKVSPRLRGGHLPGLVSGAGRNRRRG